MPASIDFRSLVDSNTPLVIHKTCDDTLILHLYEVAIKSSIIAHQGDENYKNCRVLIYDSKSGVVTTTPEIKSGELSLRAPGQDEEDKKPKAPTPPIGSVQTSPMTRINNAFLEAEKRAKTDRSRYFFIIRDVDDLLRNNPTFFGLMNRFTDNKEQRARISVYIITTLDEVPIEYQRIALIQSYQFADDDQLTVMLAKNSEQVICRNVKRLVPIMRGLTYKQMVNYIPVALHYARVKLKAKATTQNSKEVLEEFIQTMEDFKQNIQRMSFVHMERPDKGLTEIGGNDLFKEKIFLLSKIFKASKDESEFRIQKTKGLLLTGSPGTGKSTMSKAIAYEFGIPYLRLSLNQMYGKFLGESETRLKAVLEFANSCGALVEIDEIDKEVQPDKETNATEGRVIASLLTYMAGDHNIVFVGTANAIEHLPEALYRKGRFDEIFWFDLPTREERAAIFMIHLERHGIDASKDPDSFNKVVDNSTNFVGAEIQWAIEEATRRNYAANLDKGNSKVESFWKTLYTVLDGVVPHAIHKKDAIVKARKALITVATPASSVSKFHKEFAEGLKVRQRNEEI